MRRVLVSWIGRGDLRAAQDEDAEAVGPVAQSLGASEFAAAVLLTERAGKGVRRYRRWLEKRFAAVDLQVLYEPLGAPAAFGEVYGAAVRACETAAANGSGAAALTFHLDAGTPAMAAVWIILAKTRFPAELIEWSPEHGVRTVSVPADLEAELLPEILRRPDQALVRLSAGVAPAAAEFAGIVQRSGAMQRVVLRARRVAPRSVPVLIEGEFGTGKELLARAIHNAGPRRGCPFVTVHCGAIPPEMVEGALYGNAKGAVAGAGARRTGAFLEAAGGALLLDEVDALPRPAQVTLLAALRARAVLPVGGARSVPADVRVFAATNRPLAARVAAGAFRPELFHHLAVAVLRLPPLRERPEDLRDLIDHCLAVVNRGGREQPGYREKSLSEGAMNLLMEHSWPGNVRELQSTLNRAALWTPDAVLSADDVRDALLPVTADPGDDPVLGRPLGPGLDLPELLATVARHYLQRALDQVQGNKTRAAALVGLPSYQTFTNWIQRYGIAP